MERYTKLADFCHLKNAGRLRLSFNPSVHKKEIFDLAFSCRFIREAKDVLFLEPPGVGKTHLAQAIGYDVIRQNFLVLYRSIFDLVRDFMKDEAFNQMDKTVRKYLKPDLVIIDDMGLKQLPKHSGEYLLEVIMRRYEKPFHHHDQQSPVGGMGQSCSVTFPLPVPSSTGSCITPRSSPSMAKVIASRRKPRWSPRKTRKVVNQTNL